MTDQLVVDSPRAGGKYAITNTAQAMLGQLEPSQRASITNWLVNQRHSGTAVPLITSKMLKAVRDGAKVPVSERVDRLLMWLSKNMPALGRNLAIGTYIQVNTTPKLLERNTQLLGAEIGSLDDHETLEILNLASKSNFIEFNSKPGDSGGFVSLTFPGYQRIEHLERQQPKSEQAFVAMWFHPSMEEIFENGFRLAIEDAGYRALRIDRKEHNNKIDDEIIVEIRRSKFVVADFTSAVLRAAEVASLSADVAVARGGVYFEAGFAKGLNKEVIWTVRKDLIELVHFDTRQFAHITWESVVDLRKNLATRISATLGDGPLKRST